MLRLCALLLTCASLFAQATPEELAQEVLKRFELGSLDDFVKLLFRSAMGRSLLPLQLSISCLAGQVWRESYTSQAIVPFCC